MNAAAGKSENFVHGEVFIKFLRIEMDKRQHSLPAVTTPQAPVKKMAPVEPTPVAQVKEVASPIPPVSSIATDWDSYPLPEHWSRKIDKKTNRVILS